MLEVDRITKEEEVKMKRNFVWYMCIGILTLLVAVAIHAGGSKEESAPAPEVEEREMPVPMEIEMGEIKTRGPEGQVPLWYTDISLTEAEKEIIRKGKNGKKYVIAYDQLNVSEFDDAIGFAIDYMAEDLNMEYIHTYNRFDASVQKDNVETILAKKPDIIAAVSVDPVVSGEAFRRAAELGVTLVFCSVKAPLEWGTEYNGGLVFYDLIGFGPLLAEELNTVLNGNGEVGIVYHQANFFITNQRDQGFEDALDRYPGLTIADKRPTGNTIQDTEAIVSAMITKNPEIDGIYLPWQEHVMPAISALRAANREDIKIVTQDIGKTTALEMIRGDNLAMMTQCMAWQYGVTVTEMGCYAILGKEIPAECIIVPGLASTWETIDQVWPRVFNTPLPEELQSSLDRRRAK
jgi:ribose transport system substrate-binding protein